MNKVKTKAKTRSRMIGVVGIFYYYGVVGASITTMASMGACANGILVLAVVVTMSTTGHLYL